MAEDLKTLREAALALDGVRIRIGGVDGKLNLLIAGVATAAALIAGSTAYLHNQISDMKASLGRMDERTAMLVRTTSEMSETLTQVRDELVAIRGASGGQKQGRVLSPDPAAFTGWSGIQAPNTETLQRALPIQAVEDGNEPLWVFSPDANLIRELEQKFRE